MIVTKTIFPLSDRDAEVHFLSKELLKDRMEEQNKVWSDNGEMPSAINDPVSDSSVPTKLICDSR